MGEWGVGDGGEEGIHLEWSCTGKAWFSELAGVYMYGGAKNMAVETLMLLATAV